jgi:hypothetical protein
VAPRVEAVVFVEAAKDETFGGLVERTFDLVFLCDELAVPGKQLDGCRVGDCYGDRHWPVLPLQSHEAQRPRHENKNF